MQSKLKVEKSFAFGINVPWFTDWQTGAEFNVPQALPSAPHFAMVSL
jgi:hypothetical protein